MITNLKHPYQSAEGLEVFGKYSYGIKIDIANGRELTEDEKKVCAKALSDIRKVVEKENMRLDPDVQGNIIAEKADLIALFPQPVYVKPIPNEYEMGSLRPWFLVTTTKGVIKIGWRHRVINIDWTESDITASAEELFPAEKVAKGEKNIYAWDYDKAKEYIAKILA